MTLHFLNTEGHQPGGVAMRVRKLEMVRPSFLEGMVRIVDIGGMLRDEGIASPERQRRSSTQALSKCRGQVLNSDWTKVRRDLVVSTKRVITKYSEHNR
jgi:hypothetical protein